MSRHISEVIFDVLADPELVVNPKVQELITTSTETIARLTGELSDAVSS